MGNPDLEPVLANTFSASYRKSSQKWTIGLRANASLADNSILRVTTVDDKGVKSSTYENIGTNNNYSIYPSVSYRLGQKLSIYLNGSIKYTDLSSKEMGLSNSGFSYSGSLGGNVKLWKGASVYANYGIYSSGVNLQGSGSSFSYHSIGLSQRVFKEKMGISLSASNPFSKDQVYSNTVEDTTFKSYNESVRNQQTYRMSVNYRFGKMSTKVKKARRTINNDDQLAGGGESSGGDK